MRRFEFWQDIGLEKGFHHGGDLFLRPVPSLYILALRDRGKTMPIQTHSFSGYSCECSQHSQGAILFSRRSLVRISRGEGSVRLSRYQTRLARTYLATTPWMKFSMGMRVALRPSTRADMKDSAVEAGFV